MKSMILTEAQSQLKLSLVCSTLKSDLSSTQVAKQNVNNPEGGLLNNKSSCLAHA
jgi:hypothetical protein